MGVIAEGILRGCQGLFTPVFLGYPLSVFNKNSTLNPRVLGYPQSVVNKISTLNLSKKKKENHTRSGRGLQHLIGTTKRVFAVR